MRGVKMIFSERFIYFIRCSTFLSIIFSTLTKSIAADMEKDNSSDKRNAIWRFYAEENEPDRPTVPKCCYLGYGFTYENKSTCVATESEFLPDFQDRPDYTDKAVTLPAFDRYEYYIGDPCTDGKYILDTEAYSYDKYSVFSNGTLYYLQEIYSKENFCMETLNDTVRVFLCFGVSKNITNKNLKFTLYAVGLLISVPFLLGTALVYLGIELLRDLRGKSLSCHVICLAIGYVFLAFVQLASDKLNQDMCIAAGFVIQFSFVAAFFWLNIICFDTWRSINNNSCCINRPLHLASEKIIFRYYFIYGFYGPIILSIVSLIMDLEPAIPESYLKPNFGLKSCWFYSNDAALPYFYAPVGLTICINILFFILSTKKIYDEYKKRDKESTDGSPDKLHSIKIYTQILQESVYLFCLMGINWTAEIISWAIGGSELIWLVTDIFNTLQGIVIFYLFVAKPQNVRNQLKRRFQVICYKAITCDCSRKNESDWVTRHWHSREHETAETGFTSENNQFIKTPAVV